MDVSVMLQYSQIFNKLGYNVVLVHMIRVESEPESEPIMMSRDKITLSDVSWELSKGGYINNNESDWVNDGKGSRDEWMSKENVEKVKILWNIKTHSSTQLQT